MNSKEIAMLAANSLDDKKATNVVVIDIAEKSSFADFFVLASGVNDRQVSALSDEVETVMEKSGVELKTIEGKNGSGWILMDYGDVIVNVLSVDMRERYKMEKIWGDCEFIEDFESFKNQLPE